MAASPLLCEAPKRGRKCYVTPAFSGVPNAKRGENIRSGCLTPTFSEAQKRAKCYVTRALLGVPNAKRGEEIRSAYLTLAFSGAHKRAEVLRDPCILGGPQCQVWGENQKCLPHPCLLRSAEEGGSAT